MRLQLYLTIFVMFVCNQVWSQTETCLQNLNHPGNNIISQVVGSETINREYILYVPQNYDDNVPTPLIINLHGFGDCASDYADTVGDFYEFSKLADEENIIIAYPQGAFRPEKDDTYWEPGDVGVDNIYENDLYFIEQLISDVSSSYNLDTEMIFACGYSNGGMMTYSLACNRSSLFSAIGIMSGTMLQEDCTLERAVPIIKFHGIADGVLPYNGNVWYDSVEEVVDFWLDQNNIPKSSLNSSELNDGKVILDVYSGGNDNSCLSLYTINEEYDKPGDHVWFSDKINGSTPNGIMWDFFADKSSNSSSTSSATEDQILVFPNPVRSQLKVLGAIGHNYSLTDMRGNMVLNGKIRLESETINIQHLQSGIYSIRIGSQNTKLIVVE